MFHKLLIANRGEVAVRVANTARRLGIETVGITSTADAGASWTELFDAVVCVGPAAARDSYLDAERIVQAGLQHGCAAVHPGWGFLAENGRFAALCEQHGLRFVGPPCDVIETLGSKLPAKRAMRGAGLPGIPGSDGWVRSAAEAAAVAERVGYPVILKADAGGGGRGMRRCDDATTLDAAFAEASAEAAAAFGDPALYLEKYVRGGRHIEVQILADAHGAAVHLGERDCSLQRSHQKLIEESPSPALTAAESASLGADAARAARALGYRGAGTIEFLRADDGALYFMEMNARLQVEHPVSEMRTGIDIVEEQLRIAAGAPLRMRQDSVRPQGCAIECRINAEDPRDGFRPTPGRLQELTVPTAADDATLRFDTHLRAGDEITPYYDSLIGKLIAHAESRPRAIAALLASLQASRIEGVATTIPLHLAVLQSAEFQRGDYDTAALPGWPVKGLPHG